MTKNELIQLLRQHCNISKAAKEVGVGRRTIYDWCKRFNVHPQGIKFDHHFFHEINNEKKAYWLGFLYADGCVFTKQKKGSNSLHLKLSIKDKNHLEKFREHLSCCVRTHYNRNCIYLKLCSNNLCNDLISHGCTPKKSLTLEFPHFLQDDLIHHFIRGYFDGDGSASIRRKNCLRLSLIGTYNFLTGFQNYICNYLHVTPVKISQSAGRAFVWDKCGNIQAKEIAQWMYSGASVYLPRKRRICKV